MLNFILRNLVENAIKFTELNGHVKVTAFENGESIHVKIKDDGIPKIT